MQSIPQIIADLKTRRRGANPIEQAFDICLHHPEQVLDLVRQGIEADAEGTYLDAAISYLPLEQFSEVVNSALSVLRRIPENPAAESVIAYISLQNPRALHSHLDEIFALSINRQYYYGHYPWRESKLLHFDFLRDVTHNSPIISRRQQAYRALLETRHPQSIEHFVKHFDESQFPHDANAYLHLAGWDLAESQLIELDTNQPFHLAFPRDYWLGEDAFIWLKKANHPTWELDVENAPSLKFGGLGEGKCKLCNNPLCHILTLTSIPNALKISIGDSLTLETCLSCLGREEPLLFYSHDSSGKPNHISENKELIVPQFPAGVFKKITIHLVENNSRWRWQDWGLSNSRENLNRIGGTPAWVQSPQYPLCPQCQTTMHFLLQLDSGFPVSSEDGQDEWLWGTGGMCYGFWCDTCRISGFLWQCT